MLEKLNDIFKPKIVESSLAETSSIMVDTAEEVDFVSEQKPDTLLEVIPLPDTLLDNSAGGEESVPEEELLEPQGLEQGHLE